MDCLSQDWGKLLGPEPRIKPDTVVTVGSNNQEFKVHSFVLRTRSAYFNGVFSGDSVKKNSAGMFVLKMPDVSGATFEIAVSYIYTGKINWWKVDKEPLGVIKAVDEFQLKELLEDVENHLIRNRETWLAKNTINILNTVIGRSNCQKMLSHMITRVRTDPYPIFYDKDFIHLDQSVLLRLLKYDDFAMEEIHIWECLVKWVMAKSPLPDQSTVSQWSSPDFTVFQKAIGPFLPHIRFIDISGQDYLQKVKPFKVVSGEMKSELVKFHYNPLYKPKFKFLPARNKIFDLVNIAGCMANRKLD